MKKLLFIFFLLPFIVKAQTVNNQKVRWMQPIYMGSNTAATVNSSSDTGAFFFDRADSVLYFKYKGAARAIGYAGASTVDSSVYSTRAWRQKGVDSVSSNLVAGLALKLNITDTSSMLSPYYRTALANATIVQRITDSLRSLVRLRASGSGGIQLQNSNGTNVADFGIANTTNGSIAGGWNVGGNSTISGTLGVTQKATFSDSIVGVNQRLSGNISAATFNGSALGSYAYRSSGLAELSGATFTGQVLNTSAGAAIAISNASDVWYNVTRGSSITNIGVDATGSFYNTNTNHRFLTQFGGVEALRITSSGNVGIGTTSPNRLLELANTSGSTLGIVNSVTGGGVGIMYGRLAFYSTAFSNSYIDYGAEIRGYSEEGVDRSNLRFYTSFSATTTERMRITGAGNVGIGTTSPSRRLSLSVSPSSTGDDGITISNGTNDFLFTRTGSSYTYRGVPAGAGMIYAGTNIALLADGANITFHNGSGETFRVASTGAATFSSSVTAQGALTATAQGNNIAVGVDSSVTSTSYTLVLGDAGYLKRCSNASAITITVPTNASVAFPIGTTIYFSQQGAGKVSVSPATSDVTIQSEGSLLGTAGQHAVIGLIKVNTNRWLLVGNRG